MKKCEKQWKTAKMEKWPFWGSKADFGTDSSVKVKKWPAWFNVWKNQKVEKQWKITKNSEKQQKSHFSLLKRCLHLIGKRKNTKNSEKQQKSEFWQNLTDKDYLKNEKCEKWRKVKIRKSEKFWPIMSSISKSFLQIFRVWSGGQKVGTLLLKVHIDKDPLYSKCEKWKWKTKSWKSEKSCVLFSITARTKRLLRERAKTRKWRKVDFWTILDVFLRSA